MARKRFKVRGLLATATPEPQERGQKRFRQSELSVALLAFSEGTATEEQVRMLTELKVSLRKWDQRLTAPTRTRRGIPTQTITIFGETFELTKEDLEEFKEWKEKRERMHEDKSLELLISEEY